MKLGMGSMYDMYPDRWTGHDNRRLRQVVERPRRRVRRTDEAQQEFVRIRQERRSADR
jgi:hypothetical protein